MLDLKKKKMKKILLLALLFPVLSIAQQNRTGKVSQAITAAKAISGEFQYFEIFNSQTEKDNKSLNKRRNILNTNPMKSVIWILLEFQITEINCFGFLN